ncbi:MAG: hypothetical protein IT460_14165 [Planctomycetes bacterium]|nr:hypothetical protein [Planctomycetota bacterium]
MTDATPPAAPVPGAAPAPASPDAAAAARLDATLGERLSDRLNPILVREVQQAMNGKTVVVALALALLAIVLTGLAVASDGNAGRRDGWDAFVTGMRVLAPLLLLVVPVQSFLSMRQEVTAGTVEHLLLSRLTPGAIVRGKLAAAAVEIVLFFSVFAPLLALTYLLRGVDVPTIAAALGLLFLYALGACAFGVAGGALCRWSAFRALPLIVVCLGLMLGSAIVTAGMEFLVRDVARDLRRGGSAFREAMFWFVPAVACLPFCALVASAALAHPYENRSTWFRVFAVAALGLLPTWVAWDLASRPYATPDLGKVVPHVVLACAVATLPFWLFAVTEPDRFTPRVRTLVPRHRVLALLCAPFLPGGARGFLWTVFLALGAFLLAWGLPLAVGTQAQPVALERTATAWCYVVVYAGVARLLRNRFADPGRGAVFARIAFPVVLLLVTLLPSVSDLFLPAGSAPAAVHALSPFRALGDHLVGDLPWLRAAVAAAAALVLLLQAPAIARGLRETLAASAERRARAR